MVLMPRRRRRTLFGGARNRRVRSAPAKAPDRVVPEAPPRPPLKVRLGNAVRAVGRAMRAATRGLVAILLAAGVGAGVWVGQRAVLTSPRFAVTDVVTSPTRHLDAAELAVAIGVERGTNIFAVDPRRVERDVAALPWVARATVRRQLPNTIVVDVVEREPALLVELQGLYLADREGLVFKRAETAETEGLIVVTGIEREAYLAERPTATALMRRALALVTRYQATPGRPSLSEVRVGDEDTFVLYTAAGATAIRLADGDLDRQLARFDVVWRALGQRQALARAIYLDNRTRPDRVAVRLAAGSSPSGAAAHPVEPGM